MPSLATRVHVDEMMDDFSIADERLTRALGELRWINRFLGGYAATLRALAPYLRRHGGRPIRLLDVGTGVADYPEEIVRWADRRGLHVEVVAVDANPATVAYARQTLDRRLPPRLARRIRVEVGDALALPYDDDAFDVATAALFLHHFDHDEAVRLLAGMARVAREGVVVNDLHRHHAAYLGILGIVNLLPVSPMVRHDGPLSVRRAFRREELAALARAAGLGPFELRWRWAFRWLLTSLTTP